MRPIIFRGKVATGEWVYGAYCNMPSMYKSSIPNCEIQILCSRIPVKPETVGQYTGFNARGGEHIYDGDIITTPEGHDPNNDCKSMTIPS
jgi:hypothetical protein